MDYTIEMDINKIIVTDMNGDDICLYTLIENNKNTIMYFLRDSACVLAMDAIRQLREEFGRLDGLNIGLIAAVDSSHECAVLNLGTRLPFPVVTGSGLYEMFDIAVSPSKEAMEGPETQEKIARAKARGFVHGVDSGSPLRIPSAILFDQDGGIIYEYRGRTADDVPFLDALIEHIR